MIPAGVKVFLASHQIDLRNGPNSLLPQVRDAGGDPFNSSLYVFRPKRADRIKIVLVGWIRGLPRLEVVGRLSEPDIRVDTIDVKKPVIIKGTESC